MTTMMLLFPWCLAALSTEHISLSVKNERPEVSQKKKLSGRGSELIEKYMSHFGPHT